MNGEKKPISNEYLSKDILDDDFLQIFTPFFRLQYVIGSTRVDARDRFVTAPTKYQKCFTIFVSFITIAISIATIFANKILDTELDTNMFLLNISHQFINGITFFGNIIHTRFLNNDANVKLMIQMQEIERLMGIQNNKSMRIILFWNNFLTISFLVITFIVLLGFALSGGIFITFSFIALTLSDVAFIVEIYYGANLLVYFFTRLRFTNSIISNQIDGNQIGGNIKKASKSSNVAFPTKVLMKQLAAESHNFVKSDTDIYINEILNCFSTYQELYKFQVLIFFFSYISTILVSVQYAILNAGKNIMQYQNWIVFGTLMWIRSMQCIFLCIRTEIFLREIKETKRLALDIMSRYFDGPIRKKAKNIYKTIQDKQPRFSVYDMWELNGSVLISVFSLATSLLVTQLQFALL